jgi:hypothetical protein
MIYTPQLKIFIALDEMKKFQNFYITSLVLTRLARGCPNFFHDTTLANWSNFLASVEAITSLQNLAIRPFHQESPSFPVFFIIPFMSYYSELR